MHTAYRDYEYGSWARKQERKAKLKRFFLRVFVLALFFCVGMGTQYYRDGEMRDMASDCMKRDLAALPSHEVMPKPTAAQIAETRKLIRKYPVSKKGVKP